MIGQQREATRRDRSIGERVGAAAQAGLDAAAVAAQIGSEAAVTAAQKARERAEVIARSEAVQQALNSNAAQQAREQALRLKEQTGKLRERAGAKTQQAKQAWSERLEARRNKRQELPVAETLRDLGEPTLPELPGRPDEGEGQGLADRLPR